MLLTTVTKKIKFKNLKKINIFYYTQLNSNYISLFNFYYFWCKIRTMDDTFLFISRSNVNSAFRQNFSKHRMKKFFEFFDIFFLSPASYLFVSLSNDYKRTDYPGREISDLVQRRWDRNFINDISIVVGDEWYAGNLSYHLNSRPTWFNTIENNLSSITSDTGVIYTGNPEILKKFCPEFMVLLNQSEFV